MRCDFGNEFMQQQEVLKKALIQQDYPTLETLSNT